MIILSQVEPIIEPLVEDRLWYLPNFRQPTIRMDDSETSSAIALSNFLQPFQPHPPTYPIPPSQPLSQRPLSSHGIRTFIPPFEYDDRYLQFFGLPKFQPENIEIKMDSEKRQVLIIGKYERNDDMEFECCEFTKRILIPNNVDLNKMKCTVADNGLLQIQAPLHISIEQQQKSSSKEREIPIQFVNSSGESKVPATVVESSGPSEEKLIKVEHSKTESSSPQPQSQGERTIPIEFVGQSIVPKKMPVLEQSFVPKSHEQQFNKLPVQPQVVPPPQPRQIVREIPIRMSRRPIDQGILCPCCNGHGSRIMASNRHHEHHDHHGKCEKPTAIESSPAAEREIKIQHVPKKDHKPKNYSQNSSSSVKAEELPSSSASSSNSKPRNISNVSGDLNQAIDELQKVAKGGICPAVAVNTVPIAAANTKPGDGISTEPEVIIEDIME